MIKKCVKNAKMLVFKNFLGKFVRQNVIYIVKRKTYNYGK